MRWQQLFDDLAGQLEHDLGRDEADLLAEEERLRVARLSLRDRLRPLVDSREEVAVVLRDGERVVLGMAAIGRDWVAGELAAGPRSSLVVPFWGIRAVLPSPAQLAASMRAEPAPEPPTALGARLGLGYLLRDLCRRRTPVEVRGAGEPVHGTIDRVGRDHLDLAEHPPGEPRRPSAVSRIRLVPFDAIDVVRF